MAYARKTQPGQPLPIRRLEVWDPADSLILSFRLPGQGVDLKGRRLRTLPPSVNSILQPQNATLTSATGERMASVFSNFSLYSRRFSWTCFSSLHAAALAAWTAGFIAQP